MKSYLPALTFGIVTVGFGIGVVRAADNPRFSVSHGMLAVEVDEKNKIFSESGVADLEGHVTFNAAGQTILGHNVGNAAVGILGGIAERDGNTGPNPAPALTDTTKLLADDPGFFTEASVPGNYQISANYFNTLRYFPQGGTAWTAPVSDEELLVFDLNGANSSSGPPADLQVKFNINSFGALGKINIGDTDLINDPISGQETVVGIHGHVGYMLYSRLSDDTIPARAFLRLTACCAKKPLPYGRGSSRKPDAIKHKNALRAPT